MGERPTAAFVLMLIGGIIITIAGAIGTGALLIFGGKAIDVPIAGHVLSILIGIAIMVLVFGIIIIIASIKVKSGIPSTVKTWSIVGLVLSVICLILGAAWFIGPILSLIGSILGLVWKPPTQPTTYTPSTYAQQQQSS